MYDFKKYYMIGCLVCGWKYEHAKWSVCKVWIVDKWLWNLSLKSLGKLKGDYFNI